MRQFLLASALILVPVAGFTAVELLLPGARHLASATAPAPLGDLSAYEGIVADTQALVKAGDLGAAERRITDFETRWDEAEATMRPMAAVSWGNVDAAADESFSALRAAHPDPKAVDQALAALALVLTDPAGGALPGGAIATASGIAVTDESGHPIPCETMLGNLRRALSDGSVEPVRQAEAIALQAKATERCNADDDRRSDAFTAKALALVRN